jgi:hypothetical protein
VKTTNLRALSLRRMKKSRMVEATVADHHERVPRMRNHCECSVLDEAAMFSKLTQMSGEKSKFY